MRDETVKEVEYCELQIMDDGHEALHFLVNRDKDIAPNEHNLEEWIVVFLPPGLTFNANPEIGPTEKDPEPPTELCPKHGKPWVSGEAPGGYRRCTFYIPELGVSEDYGCPQPEGDYPA